MDVTLMSKGLLFYCLLSGHQQYSGNDEITVGVANTLGCKNCKFRHKFLHRLSIHEAIQKIHFVVLSIGEEKKESLRRPQIMECSRECSVVHHSKPIEGTGEDPPYVINYTPPLTQCHPL